MPLTIDELEKAAKRSREKNTQRILSKYHIARQLGFSSSESVVLMGRSREVIRSLAIRKGFLKDGEGLPSGTDA